MGSWSRARLGGLRHNIRHNIPKKAGGQKSAKSCVTCGGPLTLPGEHSWYPGSTMGKSALPLRKRIGAMLDPKPERGFRTPKSTEECDRRLQRHSLHGEGAFVPLAGRLPPRGTVPRSQGSARRSGVRPFLGQRLFSALCAEKGRWLRGS